MTTNTTSLQHSMTYSAVGYNVKLHLRDERTNRLMDKETRLFDVRLSVSPYVRPSVRLSLCPSLRCVCQRRPSYGWNEARCFIEI